MSVKDYDARYIQLWRSASLSDVELPVATRELAINFRQRLYQLRKAMRSEQHDALSDAEKVKIKIEFAQEGRTFWHTYTNDRAAAKLGFDLRKAKWRLRMIATDADYDGILTNAGFKVPEAPDLA